MVSGSKPYYLCLRVGRTIPLIIKPAHKRRQLRALQNAYRVSTRRACEVIGLPRATWYYQSTRPTDAALRHRLKELATVRVRYGYLRLHVLLRREGWQVNHKKVYRIYCEEGLNLRSKRPRRRRAAVYCVNSAREPCGEPVLEHGFCGGQFVQRAPDTGLNCSR